MTRAVVPFMLLRSRNTVYSCCLPTGACKVTIYILQARGYVKCEVVGYLLVIINLKVIKNN